MKIKSEKISRPLDQVIVKISLAIYKKYHSLKRTSRFIKIPKKEIISIIKISSTNDYNDNLNDFFTVNNTIYGELLVNTISINKKSVVFEISDQYINFNNTFNSSFIKLDLKDSKRMILPMQTIRDLFKT